MSRAVFKKAVDGRAPRVRVTGLVRLQFASAEEFLVAEAVDLSSSGMFIAGDEVTLATVGDLVGVHFEVAGQLVLEAIARVARVVPPGGRYTPGIGVEFVKLGRDMEELLVRFVDGELARA
jgi:hypothetical protein